MSAAAVVAPAVRPAIPWVRAPKRLDWLSGYGFTPTQKLIVGAINTATQIETRRGAISISELARALECGESTVYEAMPEIEASGLVEAIRTPGRCTVYRMTFDYLGPRPAPRPASTTPPESGGVPLQYPEGSARRDKYTRARTPDTAQDTETTTPAPRPSVAAEPVTEMPNPEAVGELTARGITGRRARDLVGVHGIERVQRNVAWWERKMRRCDRPDNPTGLLIRAIENDYAAATGNRVEAMPVAKCRVCGEPLAGASIDGRHFHCDERDAGPEYQVVLDELMSRFK